MPRISREVASATYRCISPFAVYRDGVPEVYATGEEVLEGDPVLKTHAAMFEPSSARLVRRAPVEQATAAPGELRAPVVPVLPVLPSVKEF
jgi:hypothetical protein